ncbi:MAG: dephospho-CoA kinase [Bacteroidales bacterium]|nr:dephospho-CoA kinase [Candidatus Cryptobacteroides aphodequi]
MKTILITGRIGAGKSAVSRIVEAAGYPVYDSDSRTKALYASVPGLTERIEAELGVRMENLACIFSDEGLREKLEALVYPYVLADFKAWREECGAPVAFFESAVAHTKSAFADIFDSVLLVSAPLEVRVERNPKAAQRDALQAEPEKYGWRIVNDGSLEELEKKVNDYLKTI